MTKLFTYPTGEVNCWDEVGRGALMGTVVTTAVILQDPTQPITGLTNSNKLNKKQRFALYKISPATRWPGAFSAPKHKKLTASIYSKRPCWQCSRQ